MHSTASGSITAKMDSQYEEENTHTHKAISDSSPQTASTKINLSLFLIK
jgi:hypothetical protein